MQRDPRGDLRVRADEVEARLVLGFSGPEVVQPMARTPLRAAMVPTVNGSALVSKFDTPDTSTPKTQLLCNGRYGLMITNAGGGYSRWGNVEITRWRSDRTQDPWGTFCYIHEADSDRLWSNTYHPIGGKVEAYSANFALDRAVFRRADNGIQTETEDIARCSHGLIGSGDSRCHGFADDRQFAENRDYSNERLLDFPWHRTGGVHDQR